MQQRYKNAILGDLLKGFGESVCERLVAAFGGQSLYVPNTPSPQLLDAIGPDAAQWLCDLHCGCHVEFASRNALDGARHRQARDIEIASSTQSANALAKRYGITSRRVRQIRKTSRSTSLQPAQRGLTHTDKDT